MSVIPESLKCPITFELMTDPVIGSDGQTYERSAIEQWFATGKATSPITREAMSASSLRPNRAIRVAIEEYNAIAVAPAAAVTVATAVVKNNPIRPFVDEPLTVSAQVFTSDQTYLSFTITPPPVQGTTAEPQGMDVVLVLDTSGSMSSEVIAGEGSERTVATRIDLAKHAVLTIASLLGQKDRLSIVRFSESASVLLPLTQMGDAGVADVKRVINRVVADGRTNIWDAVRVSTEIANSPVSAGRNVAILMLTDGCPTEEYIPPRGLVKTMEGVVKRNPWTFHTFGYSSDIDSKLLMDMAIWGHGLFGFIPSGDMVGTVMINAIANRASTANRGVSIPYTVGGKEFILNTGPIMYGQARHFNVPTGTVSVTGTPVAITVQGTPIVSASAASVATDTDPAIRCRQELITALTRTLPTAGTRAPLVEFAGRWNSVPTSSTYIRALALDVGTTTPGSEGQLLIATKFWNTWGLHYMRSYSMAQLMEECMNFKDPGLQVYGGDLFREIQERGTSIFVNMPPMVRTGVMASATASAATATATAPVSYAHFHNSSGGCFAGNNHVKMNLGPSKPIMSIRRGDRVWTPDGPATVLYTPIFNVQARAQPMTQIDNLCITPWHPIRINGNWKSPVDIAGLSDRLIQTVYNLVLDKGHIIDVEGFECITLNHGFQDPRVKHDFFGTQAIVNAFSTQPGFAEGRPVYINCVPIKDPFTGLVTGFSDQPHNI